MNCRCIGNINNPDISVLQLADRIQDHGKLVFCGIRIPQAYDILSPVIQNDIVGIGEIDL